MEWGRFSLKDSGCLCFVMKCFSNKKEWHLHDGTLPNTETNYLNYIMMHFQCYMKQIPTLKMIYFHFNATKVKHIFQFCTIFLKIFS